jgi:hypothetical protein
MGFVNSFEECRGPWRRDGGALLLVLNLFIPQSHREQWKAVPRKADLPSVFCSEGTSPIFSNKDVLGRGGMHTSERQI